MFQRFVRWMTVCASVVLITNSASAATVDWGTLTPTDTRSIGGGLYTGTPTNQAVLDTYQFDLSAPADAAVTGVDLEFGSFNFTSLLVELFSGDPDVCAPGCFLGADSGQSGFLLSFSGLQTGIEYYLRISGIFDQSGAGIYGGVLAVSAVPIPPALILFGTAIVGLAAISRRRSQKASAFA